MTEGKVASDFVMNNLLSSTIADMAWTSISRLSKPLNVAVRNRPIEAAD